MLTVTAILGLAFLILQIVGFLQYKSQDIRFMGAGSNASYSFLLAIASLHAVHVFGGVLALIVIHVKALSSRKRSYSRCRWK